MLGEYCRGTRKDEVVKKYLLSAKNIYTPSIVLAEVARKYIRENMPEDAVKQRLEIIARISLIKGVDVELALEAGRTYLEMLEHARRWGSGAKTELKRCHSISYG